MLYLTTRFMTTKRCHFYLLRLMRVTADRHWSYCLRLLQLRPMAWPITARFPYSPIGKDFLLTNFGNCTLCFCRSCLILSDHIRCFLGTVIKDFITSTYIRVMYTVSQKSMWRYLFEHNSNINCPIIIIFGTVVTETISYWIGVSFFHLTYFEHHHYLGNHTTWKFANSAINYCK